MNTNKSLLPFMALLLMLQTFSAAAQYSLPDNRYQGFGFLFLGAEELNAGAISDRFAASGYTKPAERFVTIG
ncbi:MAG: hypothetical protein AAFP70_18745, partial [Calditrichota bacterium]